MKRTWIEAVRLAFKGPRFEDNALDVNALGELAQFQKMVAKTAEALWRAAHPGRDRLPAHFEQRTRLCLRRIEPGSAVLPLEILAVDEEVDPGQVEMLPEDAAEPRELRDAIHLSQDVFDAVERDDPLPDRFPKALLAEYARFGHKLGPEESIEFHAPSRPPTTVTPAHTERLARFREGPHEGHVDVVGEVVAADVRQKRFQLWLDGQAPVPAEFSEEQEAQITTALKEHRTLRLRLAGTGEVSSEGRLQRITEIEQIETRAIGEVPFDHSAEPIEQALARIASEVPQEEWDRLPRDLSEDPDRYIYDGGQEE